MLAHFVRFFLLVMPAFRLLYSFEGSGGSYLVVCTTWKYKSASFVSSSTMLGNSDEGLILKLLDKELVSVNNFLY